MSYLSDLFTMREVPKDTSETNVHTRITVIETVFAASQQAQSERMKREEETSKQLHLDIKMLVSKIEESLQLNNTKMSGMKEEICVKIGEKYTTKIELEKHKNIENVKTAELIKEAQSDTFKRLTALGTVIMAIVSFLGWVYIESQKLGTPNGT